MSGPAFPPTPRRAERVTIGGVTFDDPFRWLEEDSDEAIGWQRAQDTAARHRLRSWPGFEAASEAVRRHGSPAVPTGSPRPQQVGGRWFRRYVPSGERGEVLEALSGPDDASGRVLFEAAVAGEARRSLGWFSPSPDGSYVAVAVTDGMADAASVEVRDSETGTVRATLSHDWVSSLSWLPDASGFYYGAVVRADDVFQSRVVSCRLDGGEEPEGPPPSPHLFSTPHVTADGRWVLVSSGDLFQRVFHVLDRRGDGRWRPFAVDIEALFVGEVVEDRWIGFTTAGAPRGRVVAIPLDAPTERDRWVEVVPESDAVVRCCSVVGARVVVGELVDTFFRLRVFSLDGTPEGEVPLPGRGTIGPGMHWPGTSVFAPDGDTAVVFTFSSYARPPVEMRYDLDERRVTPVAGDLPDEAGWIRAEHRFCTADDGTRIPLHVVHRAGLDLSRPHPTVVRAYGGWNVAMIPAWAGPWNAFIEAGGILVDANVRGGGELGTEWWSAGRQATKQRVFDDVETVARHLVAEGLTSHEMLGGWGVSNGGLVMGTVAVQRPELFRAVAPAVPVLDMLAVVRDAQPLMCSVIEYGDPRDPADAAVLARYSACHNVRPGVAYPAILVYCSDADPRCPAWHSRKYVALLQEATASGHPVLLRVSPRSGHTPTGRAMVERTEETIAFLMNELGLVSS